MNAITSYLVLVGVIGAGEVAALTTLSQHINHLYASISAALTTVGAG